MKTRSIIPATIAVILVIIAFALVVYALGRSLAGPTGALIADGPGMACVQLADEGRFPGVSPGASPLSFDVSLTGKLTCEWAAGDLTHFEFLQFDHNAISALWGAMACVVGVVLAVTYTLRMRWRRGSVRGSESRN